MQNIENGTAASNTDLTASTPSVSDDKDGSTLSFDPEPIMPLDAYGCYYRENVTKFIDNHASKHI